MGMLSNLARFALFRIDAETAHGMTINALKTAHAGSLLPTCDNTKFPELAVKLAGLDFPNPIGMAAGFDKNGEVPDALLKLGFGHAEIGTLTPRPQPGNQRPRIFRLVEDMAVINRLGFNNKGYAHALANLQARRDKSRDEGIVGVNIGANRDSEDFIADYELGIEKFWPVASYFTVNISSPNTPGLRGLQAADALSELLTRIGIICEKMSTGVKYFPPVFLKIAPDLDETAMDEISQCLLVSTISALVVSNTTISRNGLRTASAETGGLSGRPLFEPSTIILAKMRQRLGVDFPIIGVGGIDSAQSAWEKIEAGANLLQLYTGLIYQGPTLPGKICKGLAEKLKNSGHSNIMAITGTKTDEWAEK